MSDQSITSEESQAAPAAPSLSIQDLVSMLQIITVVSQRGAIRVEEMSSVGQTYDKLVTFLEANGAIKRGASTEAEAAPAATPEE